MVECFFGEETPSILVYPGGGGGGGGQLQSRINGFFLLSWPVAPFPVYTATRGDVLSHISGNIFRSIHVEWVTHTCRIHTLFLQWYPPSKFLVQFISKVRLD